MRPYQSSDLTPDRLQMAIVARLHEVIQHRRETGWQPSDPSSEDVVPGDELVSLAGHLHLLATPDERALYEQALWPLIHISLGVQAPGQLIQGDFQPYVWETRRLLEPAEPLRLAARDIGMAPASANQDWQHDLLTLLETRIEVGCFLAGLEALWREQGAAAARSVWRRGYVQAWDQVLKDNRNALEAVAEKLRRALVDSAVPADGPWFEGVRLMVDGGNAAASVTNPPTEKDAQGTERQCLHLLLLEGWLLQEQERSEIFSDCAVYPREDQHLAVIRQQYGGEILVWFVSPESPTVDISAVALASCNAIIAAEAILIDGSGDGDDEDLLDERQGEGVWLLRFLGAVDPAGLAKPMAGADAGIRLERSLFSGSHSQITSVVEDALRKERSSTGKMDD